ncbi:uncharacterized protein KY384_005895 [Bacidia gigantensis]|uniref:uncharacterized protein n=1 Tax=Bacidia gigantensis TaxID=2732470 RepID=UPI001D04D21C|nr:uncharacterized protein KY384_005895 [Bacidia gigantensis]KAG8529260.1 hypothetical protein KY384_005895 [Bacidia gigantensis]
MTAEDRKDKEDHPPKFENVDTLILDYLIFQATKSSLEDFPYNLHHLTKVATSHDVDSLDLVGAFLSIFQTIHDTIPTGSDVEFRLRLLKFSILFTRRKLNLDSREAHKSIHNKLKQDKNVSRIGRTGSPMEVVDISDDQMDTGESTQKHPNGSLLSNPKPTISLLKSLPDFMALSAVQNARQANTNITETWMKLAAGYMAQAVIEQSLVYQSEEKDILQEAFQWGFDEESSAEEGTDAFLTNIMFFDEEAEEANATWTAIRDGHMRAVGLSLYQRAFKAHTKM